MQDRCQAWTSKVFHRFLRSRRSVRRFRERPVPQSVLYRVLRTAMRAPSAHNRQPWRFVLVQSPARREALIAALHQVWKKDLQRDGVPEGDIQVRLQRSRERLMDAPVLVCLCHDRRTEDVYTDPRRKQAEHIMGVQSTALAGVYLLLAAQAEGLAGVWMCAPLFAPEAVREALDLPISWEPQAFLLLGYPAKPPKKKCLRPLHDVLLER